MSNKFAGLSGGSKPRASKHGNKPAAKQAGGGNGNAAPAAASGNGGGAAAARAPQKDNFKATGPTALEKALAEKKKTEDAAKEQAAAEAAKKAARQQEKVDKFKAERDEAQAAADAIEDETSKDKEIALKKVLRLNRMIEEAQSTNTTKTMEQYLAEKEAASLAIEAKKRVAVDQSGLAGFVVKKEQEDEFKISTKKSAPAAPAAKKSAAPAASSGKPGKSAPAAAGKGGKSAAPAPAPKPVAKPVKVDLSAAGFRAPARDFNRAPPRAAPVKEENKFPAL